MRTSATAAGPAWQLRQEPRRKSGCGTGGGLPGKAGRDRTGGAGLRVLTFPKSDIFPRLDVGFTRRHRTIRQSVLAYGLVVVDAAGQRMQWVVSPDLHAAVGSLGGFGEIRGPSLLIRSHR